MNTHARAARARWAARLAQHAVPITVDVWRYDPPEIAPCRRCGTVIEWVELRRGGLLPVASPLVALAAVRRSRYGRTGVTIAALTVHLAVCPWAPAWLRARWGGV